MVTIRVGKKKIKLFPLLILILILFVILNLFYNLFFMLPIFKREYSYKLDNVNYKVNADVIFKRKMFSCTINEKLKIDIKDKIIYDKVLNDYKNDGYIFEDNILSRKIKVNKSCKELKKEYKKVYGNKYLIFSLNGNHSDIVSFGEEYNDLYVDAKINGKDTKDVEINTNYNKNKLGTYVTSYSIKVNDYYTKRLYRVIKIVDKKEPVITLTGDSKVVLDYNGKYYEQGFIALDDYDGDISKYVKVKNTVTTKKSGNYKITYSVKDSSGNKTKVVREVLVKEKEKKVVKEEPIIEVKEGLTYVKGILLVNKEYTLPKDYDPKVNEEAYSALKRMQADASTLGLDLSLISGYRSYKKQKELYNSYVKEDGEEKASTYSAKPGHSEHQTGLAFDIGSVDRSFEDTKEAKWMELNAHLYGFIVRYPKGKTNITGYIYEPWHVRYLGVDTASKVYNSGLCLEEYLKIN